MSVSVVAPAAAPVDPVTFAVIVSRLSGIVAEMQDRIFRTGYSTIVRESQDASCLILDVDGAVVGERVIIPLHLACLPEAVRAIRAAFGDDVHPGDAFLTNDPYLGAVPHSIDVAIVTPMFAGSRLVAFIGNIAHKSDLGGMLPGTGYAGAREVFQEGVIYRPIRIVAGGAVCRDIEAILRANTRTPELVIGDVRGQIGVARLGERRLAETFARYGLDMVLEVFAAMQDVADRRMRSALAAWPDGVFEGESFVEDDGIVLDRRLRYHVRVEKRGDGICFDLTGTDDQAVGPINILPSTARAALYFALIGMLDPTLPNNGGIARVVETRFRKGSLLNPIHPAPCNVYMNSALAVCEATVAALSGFVPHRRHAGNGGGGASILSGTRPDGTTFVQYELICSAYGALASRDGPSAVHVLITSGTTAPVEILESEYPTRMRRFELIADSGGAGRFRGGLSPRRAYEIGGPGIHWSLRSGRHVTPPYGLDGGAGGRLGRALVNPGTPSERAQPGRFSTRVEAGDVVVLEKAGGGGFGDPRARPFAEVLDDVLDDYVTRASAIADYGVDRERLDRALAAWDR
jgi:N-methylhydantoinase B